MNFDLDIQSIEQSFERIAKELLLQHAIQINDTTFEICEIEFYFFKKSGHADNYTHKHKRDAGTWRPHRSGIDITFQSADDQDGGILIRTVKKEGKFITGPLKVLDCLLEAMGNVNNKGCIQLVRTELAPAPIVKTQRYLPNKTVYAEFKSRPYRFVKYFEELKRETKSFDVPGATFDAV